MTDSNPFQPLTVVSQDTCYKPVCLYDNNGFQIWAFFEWSDKFSITSVVFCQLDGDQQVGDANFDKDGNFYVKLVKGAKPLKSFNLSKKLIKDHKYPTVIDFNDNSTVEDPVDKGTTILRDKP